MTVAAAVPENEIGRGPNYKGSDFEGWNYKKTLLGFSGFWAKITFPNSYNFMSSFQWINQMPKSGSSVVLEQ